MFVESMNVTPRRSMISFLAPWAMASKSLPLKGAAVDRSSSPSTVNR
jgi:hypothetical protein